MSQVRDSRWWITILQWLYLLCSGPVFSYTLRYIIGFGWPSGSITSLRYIVTCIIILPCCVYDRLSELVRRGWLGPLDLIYSDVVSPGTTSHTTSTIADNFTATSRETITSTAHNIDDMLIRSVLTNTKHSPTVGSMLGQRRRRWPNIDPKVVLHAPAPAPARFAYGFYSNCTFI